MRERALRIAFIVLAAALALLAGVSAYMAMELGYTYERAIRQAFYPALAQGLGPVVGLALLGLLAADHVFRTRIGQVENGLMRWVDAQGSWSPPAWDEEVERALVEGVQLGSFGYEGAEIQEALASRRSLLRERAWSVRLFALPLVALSAMAGFALWAVPAAGSFLEAQALLNTSFVFFISYGLPVALASLVAALLLAFWD